VCMYDVAGAAEAAKTSPPGGGAGWVSEALSE